MDNASAAANAGERKRTAGEHLAHHVCFAALGAAILILTWRLVAVVFSYAIGNDSASHILLVPLIAAFLIFTARRQVYSAPAWSIQLGAGLVLVGAFAYLWLSSRSLAEGGWSLSGAALAAIIAWIGAFSLCYGHRATRASLFPLLLLFLAVPWPDPILSRVIYALQQGSTGIAYAIFKFLGVPVLREGFLLSVPHVTIQVAQECSSIRSSIALFITCLLAAHFFLRRIWSTLVFLSIAVLFSVVKNGIRIATLTLLSIYVDPSFLSGDLHRDGGVVFFLLALVMLWPLLLVLQKIETSQRPAPRMIASKPL